MKSIDAISSHDDDFGTLEFLSATMRGFVLADVVQKGAVQDIVCVLS